VFNYAQAKVTPQSFVDTYVSYKPLTKSRLIFSFTVKNVANNIHYQNITWGGTPSLWLGAISPPRTIFFKATYSF
jgi:hypothetical protein